MTDILLPTDEKPSRIHRPAAAPAALPVDDVAQTLAEYTRYALSTGAKLEIDPVEFTADGEVWVPLWLHAEHPEAARATVRRDGIPTVVYRRWAEALPGPLVTTADGRLWRDIWEANPTERLESYVLRAALARAFADVIGDRPEPGKPRVTSPSGVDGWDPVPPPPADLEQLADEILARYEPAVTESPVAAIPAGQTRPVEVAVMRQARVESRPASRVAVVPHPPARDVPHLEPVKPVSRKAKSRDARDSGRRGGGRW